MKILTIMGTPHKGNTRAIVDLFLEEFKNTDNIFEEIVLPNDLNDICVGCATCILNGEEKCPHYNKINPLIKKMEEADLIIISTPVFVYSCSGALKTFIDHLAYIWLTHRPKESMFNKVGLVITTAGGAGVKNTQKLIKDNMYFWGIPKIHTYSITNMRMGGNYNECNKKDIIKKEITKKAKKVTKSLSKRKV